MASFTINLNGDTYKGATAPAVDQFHALHLACNSKLIMAMQEGLAEKAALLLLMTMPWNELNTLSKLLVDGRITRESDGVEVAANLFRDAPEQWGLLVLEVARENLAGFYTLRGETKSAAAVKPQNPQATTTPTP